MIDMGVIDRITPHLEVHDCWIWTRALNSAGYGHVSYKNKVYRVHRVLYQALVGPLHPKIQLDHMCRTRACANPDHLDPISNKENWLRGAHRGARVYRGTVDTRGCGHPLSPENTYTRSNGTTRCRQCELNGSRARRIKESA